MKEKDQKVDYNKLAMQAATDEIAFSELYEYFFPRVYNFLFSRMKNSDAADEVVSIAFEKVFLHLKSYDAEKAAFSTWIFRIASNAMLDYYRHRQRCSEDSWGDGFTPADDLQKGPEQQLMLSEDIRALLQAVDGLKERERDIIALKYWSGLSNREIAAIKQMSEGNVGVVLFRAVGSLKKMLSADHKEK